MGYAASENPRVTKPVYLFGLSLEVGEHTREQLAGRRRPRARGLGLAEHQAVLIAHTDTDTEHVHVVVRRARRASQGSCGGGAC
jgi:hypothetical protein